MGSRNSRNKGIKQVYINSPKNNVIKSAPVQLYKKGDHVTYQAVITNPNPGTFMRNLEIQDELQAEGIKIIPGTVAVISGGKNIASECKITFDPSGRSYEIITPLALKMVRFQQWVRKKERKQDLMKIFA